MTQPFIDTNSHYGTSSINTLLNPPELFYARKPIGPPDLRVVKLTKENLAKVIMEMLNNSSYGVQTPPSRDGVTITDWDDGSRVSFLIGEWIVVDRDKTYRHATEDESQTYGLDKQ